MAGSGSSLPQLGFGRAQSLAGRLNYGLVRHCRGGSGAPVGAGRGLYSLIQGCDRRCLHWVEPDERGDPMSPLRWTTKSPRKPTAELTRQEHRVSADTVAGLLREEGFSPQANVKTIEGTHPTGMPSSVVSMSRHEITGTSVPR